MLAAIVLSLLASQSEAFADVVLGQAFSRMDANDDGVITRDEFAAATAAGLILNILLPLHGAHATQ